MKEYFNIDDIAMMPGLSSRTIRSYIADGFLVGDKSNGTWQFSAAQVDAFLQNKTAQPTLRSKKNAIVYDFIGNKPTGETRICIVLDVPKNDLQRASTLFCEYIKGYEPKSELHFAADPIGNGGRIILSGADSDVLDMMNRYYSERWFSASGNKKQAVTVLTVTACYFISCSSPSKKVS